MQYNRQVNLKAQTPTNSRFRPQTPQPNSNRFQQPKLVNRFQQPLEPHYPNINNLTKSRVSVNSSTSGLGFLAQSDPNQMFPEDLIFLLRNEDRNINHFKQKIEKQKLKVQNDFSVFRDQIEHIIQDLKISVQAQLDLVYKTFITKYAEMKGQVQEIRKMRKQILLQNGGNNQINFNNSNHTSNKDLIQQIQKDAEQFRGYKVYGYLSELIKQKLQPILELSNELILIGSTQSAFYRNREMNQSLKGIKMNVNGLFGNIYEKLSDYILTPQRIVERDRLEEQNWNSNTVLRSVDANYHNLRQNETSKFQKGQNYHNLNQKHSNTNTGFRISPNEQSLATKWCENVHLNRLQNIVTDHTDSILCIFFIADKYIVTGSKDKTINVYTLEGKKITVLKGHQAAICCLSSIVDTNGSVMLASGSDHGCSCLILWDIRSWTIASRIQAHTAAVTAIVDMGDGCHLVTGSYDKKINLYNFAKSELVFSLNNNKTSVTAIVLSSDRNRLVTSGLDNGLSIWAVLRRNNIVDSIQLQRTIPNNTLLSSLNSLQLRPEYVLGGARDGKIKLFNIITGEVVKTYVVNQNSVIEVILIQRQMKDDCPLVLSCSSKDKSLIFTKMETGISSYLNVDGSVSVQFGCGIGPKIVMNKNRGGIMVVLSQAALRRQFTIYQIIPK